MTENTMEVNMASTDDSRCSTNLSQFGPHALMAFSSDQKYMDVFQVQADLSDSPHQKNFSIDENFHSRCSSELDDENKIDYHIEMNSAFCAGKQVISQVRDGSESNWMYNVQAIRLAEDVINVSGLHYIKETYDDLEEDEKKTSSENESDLWQLYQELLMQKKMEGKMAQSEEQKREKMREIGRIRARLYRAKLKQNDEAWKKHKAMRAQKQREERLKMSEEQREKIKALARIRAKKHREKLKENEETWKKYKEMRAEKQRLERIKAKSQGKEEGEQLELMHLAQQSEKSKGLARERAKKHRERLKEDADTWILYKQTRAQKKREDRQNMPEEQRERLKELARIRAKKYREKLKENAMEWKRYKEMRARKQREERMKLSEEEKAKAKALARERAKLYREKKRIRQQMCTDGSVVPCWYENSNSESNNCSVYFHHSFIQSMLKDEQ